MMPVCSRCNIAIDEETSEGICFHDSEENKTFICAECIENFWDEVLEEMKSGETIDDNNNTEDHS